MQVCQMSPASLLEWCASLLPPLGACLRHPNAMIRKTAIGSFVAMHAVLGPEALPPLLQDLSMVQKRLIQVYVDKEAASNANASSSSRSSLLAAGPPKQPSGGSTVHGLLGAPSSAFSTDFFPINSQQHSNYYRA